VGAAPPPFVPPPQGYGPPRRKSNTALIITIILICVLVPCIAIVGLGFWGWSFARKNIFPLAGCGFAFAETRAGLLDYAKAHDNKLPDAAKWQDEIRSYVVKAMARHHEDLGPIKPMDPNKPFGCEPMGNAEIGTGISFNSELSGKKLADLKDNDILIFEIAAPSPNANGPYKDRGETAPPFMGIPREWIHAPYKGRIRGMNTKRTKVNDPNWDFSDDSDSDTSSSKSDSSGDKSGKSDKSGASGGSDINIKVTPGGNSNN